MSIIYKHILFTNNTKEGELVALIFKRFLEEILEKENDIYMTPTIVTTCVEEILKRDKEKYTVAHIVEFSPFECTNEKVSKCFEEEIVNEILSFLITNKRLSVSHLDSKYKWRENYHHETSPKEIVLEYFNYLTQSTKNEFLEYFTRKELKLIKNL